MEGAFQFSENLYDKVSIDHVPEFRRPEVIKRNKLKPSTKNRASCQNLLASVPIAYDDCKR